MTQEEKKELFPYVLWFNLLIGFYNLYLYSNGGWWFNLLVGSLNIGVWVFNRKVLFKWINKIGFMKMYITILNIN